MQKLAFYLVFAFLMMSVAATAQDADTANGKPDLSQTPWKDYNVPEGTQLTIETINGKEVKKLNLPGNVTITDDGLSVDNSGKGAVLCMKMIYSEIKNMFEICDETNTDVINTLHMGLDKINIFIADNSLLPVTLQQLKDNDDKDFTEEKLKLQKLGKSEYCGQHPFFSLKSAQKPLTTEKITNDIEDLLSVPRPPVLNPCL